MIIHFDVDAYLFPLLSGNREAVEITPETVKRIPHKEIITILTIKTQSLLSKEVLAHFPKLRLVVTRTVGVDHIDLSECKRRGIAVYNIPNYGAQHVAQHAVALMLCAARSIIPANLDTHKGRFSYKNFLGLSMDGKTLGVIGTGKIGLEVIKICKSLGMRIVAYDIYKNEAAAKKVGFEYVSLRDLLTMSHVVTLHIPATPQTHHLLNTETLSYLKKGAILVNTGRGDLIDTSALEKVIAKFHGVCLDVVEGELTFSRKHPLLKYPNVIITPHCAFYTDESLKIIARETTANIVRFKKGDKTNRVV